jgi:hypothetical protein
MALSATQQRNALSEGIALGLAMLDRCEIPYEKLRIDLAFEHAWRQWPDEYRSKFSQVSTDIRKGLNGSLVLTHATEKKQTFLFFWERGRDLTIYARRGWDPDDPDDPDDVRFALDIIGGDLPLTAWQQLAQDFIDDVDDWGGTAHRRRGTS